MMIEIPDWVSHLIMAVITAYFLNWKGAIAKYRQDKNEQKISEKNPENISKD